LGLTVDSIEPKGVITKGSLEDTYYLNLNLRTGNKVLWEIGRFNARNADELYAEARKIEWDKYFPLQKMFSIESFVKNDTIKDTRFANLRLKDAIADFFVSKTGKRPNSGADKSEVVLFLHWLDDEVALFINTSGETIAKHGYRQAAVKAPMIESLASAVLMSTRWDMNSPLVNPMCGSGTLAIEAALLALNRCPGHFRENFSFMHLQGYNPRVWKVIKSEARKVERTGLAFPIIASDNSEEAISVARENAQYAGVSNLIKFQVCDFSNTLIPKQRGVIIMNPEYGERLGDVEQLEKTYEEMGDFLKQKCTGYLGYIFTGNLDLAKKIGLQAQRKIEFFNGKIDCRLLEYELFAGKKQ